MSTVTSVSELDALPGLDAAKRALKGIFSRDADVHAVLLYGEEGAGKSALARLLAQFWICTQPGANGPCNQCPACTSFQRNLSPDLVSIRPAGKSEWIRLHKIHLVNPMPDDDEEPTVPIQDFLRTMPLRSRHKVVVIEQPQRLTNDAAKALLKTLEEPEAHGRFVLTSTELSRVHPTIRSRCMLVPCELPDEQSWAQSVGQHEIWERELSRNSPGVTQRMRENSEVFAGIHEIARDVLRARPEAALALSERFRKLIGDLQKGEESGARAAAGVALEALGAALAVKNFSPAGRQRIAESHRRIQGNVQAGLELDALFFALLAENED